MAYGDRRIVNSHRLISAAIVACSVLARPASATVAGADAPSDSLAASQASIQWSMTYASKYLFQGGLDYSEGRPVLQPQVTASWNGLSLQAWSSWDQARREVNELDATIQQEWAEGPASGAVGFAHLHYPHRDWRPTQELIGSVAFNAVLEPTLDVHWDLAEGHGAYWTAGVSRGLPISRAAFSLSSKLYGLEHYYGVTGMTALEAAVTVTSQWTGFSFEPSLLRQWTWENHDLTGESRIAPGWLLTLAVSPR